ncbi:MAG: Protein of unknown function rane [Firmicutes bacterium]|nr:Protein of unknown function rane [Bacillota bacterium]
MINNKSKPVVEAGMMSAIAVILSLISMYIPYLVLILPVPIILIGVNHGLKWSVMVTIVSGVLISFVAGPLMAIKVIIVFGLIGVVFGQAIRAKMSAGRILYWGTLAVLLALIAAFGLTALVLGIDPFQMELSAFEEMTAQSTAIYQDSGMFTAEQLTQINLSNQTMLMLIKMLFPMSIAIGGVIFSYIIFMVASLVLKRRGHNVPSLPPFKHWVLPDYVLYIFIMGYILGYAGQHLELEKAMIVGENMKYFGGLFTFVQGLSVFYYLADKYNLSRFMRSIILLLIFTNVVYEIILVFGGAFEIALDYRRLRQPRSS